MSVMSAAEARQTAGDDPEIPPRRLQIASSAGCQDDAAPGGSPLGGGEVPTEPVATGSSASALRVTQVRVVREVRVRTLRADRTRRRTAQQSRTASQSGVAAQVAAQARLATQARVTTQATATMRAGVASQGRARGRASIASRTAVATHSQVASQAQMASQARVAGHDTVTGRDRVADRPGAVRLTRRGRRVVAVFVIGVVVVAVTLLWMSVAGSVQASSHGAAQGSPYRGMTQVVVQPGQTLWSIAAAAEPSGNAWAVVQQIMNVNALSGANVQTGQLLWVPKN